MRINVVGTRVLSGTVCRPEVAGFLGQATLVNNPLITAVKGGITSPGSTGPLTEFLLIKTHFGEVAPVASSNYSAGTDDAERFNGFSHPNSTGHGVAKRAAGPADAVFSQ